MIHQSIRSANIASPRATPLPPGFCTYLQPGSRGFVPSELPGVGPIIKVPICQLMPHKGTFQLQTDLPSVAALPVTNSVTKLVENFKTFKYGT